MTKADTHLQAHLQLLTICLFCFGVRELTFRTSRHANQKLQKSLQVCHRRKIIF